MSGQRLTISIASIYALNELARHYSTCLDVHEIEVISGVTFFPIVDLLTLLPYPY